MYTAQLKDIRATLSHMVEAGRLAETERYAEATDETVAAVLAEAGKLAEGVLRPVNRAGDLTPARVENGVVRTSPGFAEAYREIADGGWVAMAADPAHGGMGLPLTYLTAVNELMASGCLSLSLCPLMTQGAIDALETHGTPEQKAVYLPKMIAGTWTGTMNLTEPNAGSDVGALRAKAEPAGDGSYRITGGKIWISWGDNDFAENVVHLVLARLPDAPAGSRGISLFLVPKFVPDAGGAPGRRNELQVVSLDHKVGLHGSPTCVMAYEGATGWMIGEPNKGLACMFTMMNNARLGVSTEGIGVAEAAFQHALAFARDREQGRTPPIAEGERSILGHADVRRMLTAMKAQTQAARALAYDCALHLDLARAAPSESARAEAAAMGAFLTPIAKAFGTDTGNEVAHMGVQVHGGSGCIEETGAAQFSRDVRVTAIYEGTNGIQAMDLVGRKLADGGATARAFLARVEETAAALATAAELPRDPDGLGALGLQTFGAQLREAAEVARAATDWMLAAESHDRGAGAAAYLRMLALIAGGRYHGRAALSSGERRRRELARFWGEHFLPEAGALAQKATRGAKVLYALSADDLAAA